MTYDRIRQLAPGAQHLLKAGVLLAIVAMVATGQSLPLPSITSVTPNPLNVSGITAQATISGQNLLSGCNPIISIALLPPPPPAVIFGNVDVSAYVTSKSPTSLSLSIPSSLLTSMAGSTVSVTVSNYQSLNGCGQLTSNAFPLQIPAVSGGGVAGTPAITSVTPNPLNVSGVTAQVTISGQVLLSGCNPTISIALLPPPAPSVIFGNVDVSAYVTSSSPTALSLNVPSSLLTSSAGSTVSVTVSNYQNVDGCIAVTSNTVGLQIAVSGGGVAGTPAITIITPNPLNLTSITTQVTISGQSLLSTCSPIVSNNFFLPPPVVLFGNLNVSSYITSESSTTINLNVPTSLLTASAGTTLSVTVTNYQNTDGCLQNSSNAYPLQIFATTTVPTPFLNSISPRSATICGPAFTMTLIGNNFLATSLMAFSQPGIQPYGFNPDTPPSNSVMMVTFSLLQTPQIQPGQAEVQIATPSAAVQGGYVFSQQQTNFTVYATPILQSVSPTTYAAGSGNLTLQASISNYVAGITQVKWGTGSAFTTLQVVGQAPQTGGVAQVTLSVPANLIPTPTPGSTTNIQVAVVNGDDANPRATLYDPGCSPEKNIAITNAIPLQITTAAPLQEGEVGVAYQQTFVATGGAPPYSWSMTPAVAGLTLNTQSGLLSGIPAAGAAGNVTIQVTLADSALGTQKMQFPLVIDPPLSIPFSPILPAGTINVTYSQALSAAGGKQPYTWIVAPGSSAPDGLTLSSGGILSGTPTKVANYTFAVLVKDALGGFSGPQLSLTINPSTPNLSITTTALPGATLGAAYSQTLGAAGGVPGYTWTLAGSLPAGLQFDGNAGTFSGIPTAVGSFAITATVTDTAKNTNSQSFTITVGLPAAPPVTIKPSQTQSSSLTDQPTLALTLGSSYPLDLTGTFTLSFTPSAAGLPSPYIPSDLQFASGGLTTTAKIAANTTTFSLPANQGIQLGSVAGTVNVTLTALSASLPGGQTQPVAVPSPAPSTAITIQASKPVITGTVALNNKTSTGFTLEVTHTVSNTRDVTTATVTFHAAAGATLNGTTFTVPLNTGANSPSSTWFTSAAGRNAGGAFDLQMTFPYTGDPTAIGTVDVVLANSVGSSDTVSGH